MTKAIPGAWRVVFAATGINLAIGVLYAWSVIGGAIPAEWGWSQAERALPYSVGCISFALAMLPAGRLQDRIGPRIVALLGGVFVGGGYILAGLGGSSLVAYVLGVGLLGGVGIGFGYAATTPSAVRWFPARQTGMVAGIVVSGVGLAALYIAPLASVLLNLFEGRLPMAAVSATVTVLGIKTLLMVLILAQFIRNPPVGGDDHNRKPPPAAGPAATSGSAGDQSAGVLHPVAVAGDEVPAAVQPIPAGALGGGASPAQILHKRSFYLLWVMFFAGAGTGLTFLSVAQELGRNALGELAFVAVMVLALGNTTGRFIGGVVSDAYGRRPTLLSFYLLQAATLVLFQILGGSGGWLVVSILLYMVGANYGANLTLFPAICKDRFGIRHFGSNYGLLFTAWGVAGLVMPWINGWVLERTGSRLLMTLLLVAMLLLGAILTAIYKDPEVAEEAGPRSKK